MPLTIPARIMYNLNLGDILDVVRIPYVSMKSVSRVVPINPWLDRVLSNLADSTKKGVTLYWGATYLTDKL